MIDALDDTLLGPVLGALAPLGDKEVHLYMKTPDAGVGASEVQQLGGALGSSLKQLVLQECELSDDYWPAVWAHLSGLQQLSIWDGHVGRLVHRIWHSFAAVPHIPCSSFWGRSCTSTWGASWRGSASCGVCARWLSLRHSLEPQAQMQPRGLALTRRGSRQASTRPYHHSYPELAVQQ
jgi:hypothetical protein